MLSEHSLGTAHSASTGSPCGVLGVGDMDEEVSDEQQRLEMERWPRVLGHRAGPELGPNTKMHDSHRRRRK